MVSPVPLMPEQKQKPVFAWATGDPIHSVKVKTDGDSGIRSITFNSDGTQFAIACEYSYLTTKRLDIADDLFI